MKDRADLTLPVAAERILPHRPPMLLLKRLTACTELTAAAEARFPAESLFADADGRIDPVVMVELMAQTYAALRGYADLVQGQPVQEGLLVGARQVRILGAAHAGEELRVEVRTDGLYEGFALVEGEVRRGTELLAAGTVKLWVREKGGAERG